ncbi:MAG: 16S rRNA (guanine(527)-N(7))-methyltransferase RsmG [Finegoldia sp.]|nr:16S rRNA (guanine(527)-N(7))-methyltransferase RsmG [Finegoldia sp.]
MSLKEKLEEYEIEIDQEQVDLLERHAAMVLEKNKVMNLTAITDEEMFHVKHIVDSLYLLKLVDLKKDSKVIDLGTGAGFPGIPLKIARPDLEMTLFDSLNKRVDFLKEVISELELSNIEAVHGRAEEAARTEDFRERYDYCVARAVSRLDTLAEYCLPFVKVGGYMLAMKGKSGEAEIGQNAIKILGGTIIEEVSYKIADEDRNLLIIKKIKNTPKKYPRGGGKPKKQPL